MNWIVAACFNIRTGDVEDAPAPNALNTFEVLQKDGAVYIKAEEAKVKGGKRLPVASFKATGEDNVVIVGG